MCCIFIQVMLARSFVRFFILVGLLCTGKPSRQMTLQNLIMNYLYRF